MGISYKTPDDEIGKRLNDAFLKKNDFYEVNPGKVYIPKKYAEISDDISNFKVHTDDVWVLSYPRTGSTWAQEIVWLLGNNLNYESAKQIQLKRCPIIELTALLNEESIQNTVEYANNLKSPRFIRSHLPWHLLPTEIETIKPKIIYTARNPKDLCISLYHYLKLMHGLTVSFDEYCELFLNEAVPMGSYWKHVLPFWKRRTETNILFIKYEDMKRNLPEAIKKIAKFLEIEYELTGNDIERICEHVKFDKMQSNPAVNLSFLLKPDAVKEDNVKMKENQTENDDDVLREKFIRKGKIGDWENYMSEEISERYDQWTKLNTCGTGLDFIYE